jgi:membrane-associated phospholipid phosphatase
VTAGLLAALLPGKLAKETPNCRWCDRANPNGIDAWGRKARWTNDCGADALSYVTLALSVGDALSTTHGSTGKEWDVNVLTLVDSLATSTVMLQAVKYTVRRERPAAHGCLASIADGPDHDKNLSFYSGHAATAFAAVVAAGTIAHQRGYHREPVVWAVGLPFAAMTGYLRMAGNRHNFTDVLVGAAMGSAAGYLVPKYLHRPDHTPSGASARATTAVGVPVQLGPAGPFASIRVARSGSRSISLTWAW